MPEQTSIEGFPANREDKDVGPRKKLMTCGYLTRGACSATQQLLGHGTVHQPQLKLDRLRSGECYVTAFSRVDGIQTELGDSSTIYKGAMWG